MRLPLLADGSDPPNGYRKGTWQRAEQGRLRSARSCLDRYSLGDVSHVMPGMPEAAAEKIDAGMRKAMTGW
jgi:hypothetical protein